MSSKEIVDEIIKDLERIPKNINSELDIKKIAEEVSKVMERRLWRSY
jgi:hypothetical protein